MIVPSKGPPAPVVDWLPTSSWSNNATIEIVAASAAASSVSSKAIKPT